jgi:hypothetical protein
MAKEIQNPALREWFKKAKEYGQLHDSWTEIENGSEEHKAWIVYFGENCPYTLRYIEKNKNQSWTAPCKWPYDLPFQCEVPALPAPKPNLRLVREIAP